MFQNITRECPFKIFYSTAICGQQGTGSKSIYNSELIVVILVTEETEEVQVPWPGGERCATLTLFAPPTPSADWPRRISAAFYWSSCCQFYLPALNTARPGRREER